MKALRMPEESLKKAFAGCKGVIFAASASSYWGPKETDFMGVQKTASAAKAAQVDRVVLISSRYARIVALKPPHN